MPRRSLKTGRAGFNGANAALRSNHPDTASSSVLRNPNTAWNAPVSDGKHSGRIRCRRSIGGVGINSQPAQHMAKCWLIQVATRLGRTSLGDLDRASSRFRSVRRRDRFGGRRRRGSRSRRGQSGAWLASGGIVGRSGRDRLGHRGGGGRKRNFHAHRLHPSPLRRRLGVRPGEVGPWSVVLYVVVHILARGQGHAGVFRLTPCRGEQPAESQRRPDR